LKFCRKHRKVVGEDGKCEKLHPQDEGFVMPEVLMEEEDVVMEDVEVSSTGELTVGSNISDANGYGTTINDTVKRSDKESEDPPKPFVVDEDGGKHASLQEEQEKATALAAKEAALSEKERAKQAKNSRRETARAAREAEKERVAQAKKEEKETEAAVTIPCPICGVKFRADEIEEHAEDCGLKPVTTDVQADVVMEELDADSPTAAIDKARYDKAVAAFCPPPPLVPLQAVRAQGL